MDAPTTGQVRARAANRCEYCHLPQQLSALKFHIEHIVPRQHGGTDQTENLALACPDCNYRKGTNLTGIDPDNGEVTVLFHPRKQRWEDHFRKEGPRLVAMTPTGRTTVWLLELNSGERLRSREIMLRLGLWA